MNTIIMPRQGQSVESCVITKWHKKAGDAVQVGDILFTYETDKATFDEYSAIAGTFLGAIFVEGDDVPCLANVCAIGEPGEDISALGGAEHASAPAVSAPAAQEPAAPTPAANVPAPGTSSGVLFVSPRARNLAEKLRIDPALAEASGPNGRVIERDIEALAKSGVTGFATAAVDITPVAATAPAAIPVAQAPVAAMPPADYEDVKLSTVRKIIAKSMHESLSSMAQLTHHVTFDAANIMDLRAQLKQNSEKMGLPNITLNDMILFAVSRVLKNHKDLNAHFLGEHIRYFSGVNLGMAVDTPRGLLVPTIFNADKMSLSQIAVTAKSVAKSAQEGSIAPDLLSGATFTISNLGALDIEMFTPVINPPQTGILGVCAITQRVRQVNGEMKMYPAMGLSLTYDHRAVDGAPASRFLKELKDCLENFTLMLV